MCGRVHFFSSSFTNGGAAIAAFRIFNILNIKNQCIIYTKDNLLSGGLGKTNKIICKFNSFIGRMEGALLTLIYGKENVFSLNIFSIPYLLNLNKGDRLIINWVGHGFLSLFQILFIRKAKITIILHDLWFINPLAHLPFRQNISSFLLYNLSRWVKKRISNKKNVQYIATSQKMMNYAINFNQKIKIKKIRLPIPSFESYINHCQGKTTNTINIGFFSSSPSSDPNKGYEDFIKLFKSFKDSDRLKIKWHCVTNDKSIPSDLTIHDIEWSALLPEKYFINKLNDLDVILCFSKFESFGQVWYEALTLGVYLIVVNENAVAEAIVSPIQGKVFSKYDVSTLRNFILNLIDNNSISENSRMLISEIAKTENAKAESLWLDGLL